MSWNQGRVELLLSMCKVLGFIPSGGGETLNWLTEDYLMGRKRVPGSNNRDRDGRKWTVLRERTSREEKNTLRPAAEDGGLHVVVNTSHLQQFQKRWAQKHRGEEEVGAETMQT